MIGMIGKKRLAILAFLIVINAAMAGAVYFYLTPQNDKLEKELRTVKAQSAGKQSETERLRSEYKDIQKKKTHFDNLEQAGFFSDQSRFVGQKRIEDIQKFTSILTARYEIRSAVTEKNPFTAPAGHIILNSPVSVSMDALDDVDVYNFIYWMENAFPGHVSVKSLSLSRELEINDAVVREVGNGIPVTLVKGAVEFNWRTMLPESQVAQPAVAP